MDEKSLEIVVAQFNALRNEIIWINSAKLSLVEAKYLWIAGIIGGLSYFQERIKDKLDGRIILFSLNILLCSLLAFDFLYAWMDEQIICIAKYIGSNIETFFKRSSPDLSGFKFWEEYFVLAKRSHGFYLGLGHNISVVLPLVCVWGYLFYFAKLKKCTKISEIFNEFGIVNVFIFVLLVIAHIFAMFGHVS